MAALEVNVSLLEVDLTGNLIGMAETIKVKQLRFRAYIRLHDLRL